MNALTSVLSPHRESPGDTTDSTERINGQLRAYANASRVDQLIADALAVEPIFAAALDGALDAVRVAFGAIYLLREDRLLLTMKAHRAPALFEKDLEHVRTLGVAEPIVRQVVSGQRVVNVSMADFPDDPVAKGLMTAGIARVMMVPIIAIGSTVGLLALGLQDDTPVGNWQEDFLLSVAGRIGIAIDRERLHAETSHLAREHVQRNRELFALNKALQEHQVEERPSWERISELVGQLAVEAQRVRTLHGA